MELLGSPNASEKLTEQRQEEKKSNHSYSNIQKKRINQTTNGFASGRMNRMEEGKDHPPKSRMSPK